MNRLLAVCLVLAVSGCSKGKSMYPECEAASNGLEAKAKHLRLLFATEEIQTYCCPSGPKTFW